MRTLVTLTLLIATAGCGLLGDDRPSAEDAAGDLAAALSAERLADVPVTGVRDPQRWWDEVTGGIGQVAPEVTVAGVSQDGDDQASARLHYRWPLVGDRLWEYDATATLTFVDEEWQVTAEPSLVAPGLRQGEHLSAARQWAPRAEVLGAGGRRIVVDRPVVRVGIDKTKVGGAAAQAQSARRLAAVLDVDAADLVGQVRAAGDKAFVEAIVLRAGDVTPRVAAGLEAIPGATGLSDTLPLAPTREFARPILGTVGPVTAEIVEASGGVYRAGDEAGLSGLQERYDEQLRGTTGVTVSAVSESGARRTLWEAAPRPGEPLRTTLDIELQAAAERVLTPVGPPSAIVALRASTGEVVAAASGPGGGGLSTATVGRYAPGSTMKVVTSLALLRAGLTPASAMDCPAATVVDGKRFDNYSDYPPSQLGRIDLHRALAHSCNTAFIGQRDRIDQAALADAAAALGLGVDHDLGYPVFLGSVPTSSTSATDHAASMIGQGRVLASPAAMAAVAASVASGRTVVPVLVSDVAANPAPETPLTRAEAGDLRALMRAVVDGGSGGSLADVPGPPVLAKTGTAEFGQDVPPQTHAWMIAVQGDLAVAAFVETGESGSRTAGPLLEAFLRAAA